MSADFDAIIVGSGMTGGWAAKELCERGLKVLLLERGRHLDHPSPEYTDFEAPWELQYRGLVPETFAEDGRYAMLREKAWPYRNEHIQFFVDDAEYPYSFPDDRPFMWTRGYQLGGRSITWGRQSYRWGPKDFLANARDGHGIAWPIGYDDLAPWYDHVEAFAGISGNRDGLPDLPDGKFLKPMPMSCAEEQVAARLRERMPDRPLIIGRCANLSEVTEEMAALGRAPCQYRNHCSRGCSFGAYFSSLSATLPAAQKTGNLTIVSDMTVAALDFDAKAGRATGVRGFDSVTRAPRSFTGRMVFLNASAIGSVHILLNSRSETAPRGLGNSSGSLGCYIMDHFNGANGSGEVPGLEDRYAFGRRPTGIYIPNYRHERFGGADFVRGFGFQGGSVRRVEKRPNGRRKGLHVGTAGLPEYRPWRFSLGMFGEMLPYKDNTARLHPDKVDKFGIPQIHLDCHIRQNERRMIVQCAKDIREILEAAGCKHIIVNEVQSDAHIMVGARTHEMGGACMGANPAVAVTNAQCQLHDVPNVFVTDGAVMSSAATQNPSLTYMALTARAANYAADLVQSNAL